MAPGVNDEARCRHVGLTQQVHADGEFACHACGGLGMPSAEPDDMARMRRLLAEVLDAQRKAIGLRNHLAVIAPLREELSWAFPADPETLAALGRQMDRMLSDQ